MKTNRSRITGLTSAIALGLLLAVVNATALTSSSHAAAPAAKALPAQTTLTPAAPVASPASSIGEDIRDIRQPRHVPTHWLWVAVAAGVVTAFAGLVLWRLLRKTDRRELSPDQRALEHLAEACRLMDPTHAREYCFAVSQIIRSYVGEQFSLQAPRLTTEEFLRELVEGEDQIAGPQRALLGNFLEHCDLAKFAGWRYSQESLADMHGTAVEFVQQTSASPVPTPTNIPTAPARENLLVNQE